MAVQYLHLWFLLKLTLVAGQTVHYVLKDEEAILTPALKGHPDNILWRHNGNKVIEFNGAQETVYKPFEERITLAWDTAKLAIANVRYEDSGEYELDAFIRERLYRSQYLLKVLDKVSMPLIRCEINEESSDGNNTLATLFCSSESNTPEALMFKWKLDGKSHVGPDLPITLGYGHDDITYSCTVNNPLQEETSTFTAKDCYTGRTVESTEIPSTAIVVPIIVILILLVIGIFYKYWDKLKRACCKRGKNDDCENPPEKNRGVKRDTNDTDEHVPLMQSDIHRQETILSPQRLPIQEEVDETPKTGIVKDRCKMFESPTNTKANRGRHVPAPTPGPGRKDSGGELRPQDAENVPKSEEEGDAKTDSDQNENKDAPEPQSPNDGLQVEQHSLSTQEEQEGTGQTDSEKKSDERHKDHVGGVGASSPTPSTEQPGKEVLKTSVKDKRRIFESPTNTEANRGRHVPAPTPGPGRKDSGGELRPQDAENVPKSEEEGDAKTDSDQNENKDAPEPQSPNNGPQVEQHSLSTQEEQEGTGQTDSEKKSDRRHKDHVGGVGASSPTPSTEQPAGSYKTTDESAPLLANATQLPQRSPQHEQVVVTLPDPQSYKTTDESTPLLANATQLLQRSPQHVVVSPPGKEVLKTSVKDKCRIFESPTNTKANRGRHVPEPTPGPGRKDSGGELRPQDAENVPKSEKEGDAKTDSDQNENKDAPEPQSPNDGLQVEQHSLSTQEEQEGTGQTDSEKKSDERHKDHVGGVGASSPTPSTEQPGKEVLKTSVKDKRRIFESPTNTEANRGRHVPAPRPGPGRKDSGGELRPQDAENAPKSEKEGDAKTDSDQNENKDAPEPQSPNNGPQVEQHSLSTQEEQEGTGQTDSEKKSDRRHKDHVGGVGASSPTPSTEQPAGKKNTNDKDDCPPLIARDIHRQETILSSQKLPKQEEVDDLKERRVPEPTPGPGRKDSGGELRPQDSENVPKSEKEGDSDQNENKDAPEPQSPNNGPQVKQDLLPTQEEQEGTGQTDSEKKSDERHEDHENEQTTEASKAPEQPEQQSTKSETQVNQDQPAPEEQEHGGQTDSETSKLDESSKAPEQPGPQPAVSKTDKDQPLDSGPSGDEGKGHEESTTLGEEQQKQDSYSNKSKESTSNAESESKTPESEEQFDESTHPPASSSSHHADNKETKDTDGELTAYSNPPHDDQTRDDTDKESDSSGTEKRNGADKMESGEAVVDMDHKNSKA